MTDTTQQELELLSSQIQNLTKRISTMENKPGSSTGGIFSTPLNRNIGTLEKKVIEDAISDTILDIVWDKYFYYHTFFEDVVDGWSLTDSSSGTTSGVTALGVTLTSGATASNISYIVKAPDKQNVLSYDAELRFRTNFAITSDAGAGNPVSGGVKYYFGLGDVSDAATRHLGLILVNSVLYATTCNGTTTTTKQIMTGIADTRSYNVEVKFFPGYKAIFYVSDGTHPHVLERGSISTTLPDSNIGGSGDFWWVFIVENTGSTQKSAQLDYAEYIQKRVITSIV